jgi:hypothetical protein
MACGQLARAYGRTVDTGVVHWCSPGTARVGKPAARDKVDGNREFRAEIDALHKPRRLDSPGRPQTVGFGSS